jgi:hypothetical protein
LLKVEGRGADWDEAALSVLGRSAPDRSAPDRSAAAG